jgi:hypothetical protein
MPLIQPVQQKALAEKLVSYYEKLYPKTSFALESKTLNVLELEEVDFTFPGAENLADFEERVVQIKKAINHGYSTPIVLLKKGKDLILVDGHRRVVAAMQLGLNWPAILLVPSTDQSFGIEKTVLCKAREKA